MRAHSRRVKAEDNEFGIAFDSGAELQRYRYLMLRYRAGEITEPKVRPRFDITINGVTLPIYYEADFMYFEAAPHGRLGRQVVEDVKAGYWKKKQSKRGGRVVREWKERAPILTPEYKIKKCIIEALHEITITEIWE